MHFNMIEIAKLYNGNAYNYSLNRVKFLSSNGVLVEKDERLEIEITYKKIVYEVVNYLRAILPNGFHNEGIFKLDFNEMLSHLSEDARWFLSEPSINTSLAPFGDDNEALVSFNNSVVSKATNMHKAKGLPFKYRRQKFNDVFVGKSIYDVRSILEVLRLLPYDNDLDTAIMELEDKQQIRHNYLESIIAKLLLSGEQEDIFRAYLFNHFANIGFDFSRYYSKNVSYDEDVSCVRTI